MFILLWCDDYVVSFILLWEDVYDIDYDVMMTVYGVEYEVVMMLHDDDYECCDDDYVMLSMSC